MAENTPLKVGRPPIYNTMEELEQAIDLYFSDPPSKAHYTKDGDRFEIPHITITGLCIALGFESRQSFYDYEKNKDFSYIIKRARLFIENDYESALKAAQCTGAIFALKNMGWGDNQDAPRETNYTIEIINPHDTNSAN